MEWVVNVTHRQLYPREREPVPILEEAGWAPWPVWTVRKTSLPPGFDDRIAQAVASYYTDRATSAQRHVYVRTTSALCQQLCPSGPRGAADGMKKSFAVVSCLHYSMANLDPGVSFIPVQSGCNKNSNTANSSLRTSPRCYLLSERHTAISLTRTRKVLLTPHFTQIGQ